MIFTVACCRSVNLCTHAAWTFWSHQTVAVTRRMWRSCLVQPSRKEHAIGAVCCKKEGMLLQPLHWPCDENTVHHEWNVHEEQHYNMAWTSNNGVISSGVLYCCLLPQCEALRTCRSGFPIATVCICICSQLWHLWLYYRLVNRELSRNFLVDPSRRHVGYPWNRLLVVAYTTLTHIRHKPMPLRINKSSILQHYQH